MKAGVVTFPGSNCDDDCVYALGNSVGFQVTKLWHKETADLSDLDLIVLPGGFSYGDYLRCGAIAALSPVMRGVKEFANSGGLVLGICNGFQILCEAGLLPGALARNTSLVFLCHEVRVQVQNTNNPWTGKMAVADLLKLPIAHGDGRYVVSDSEAQQMQARGEIILTYCSNPNGSVADIAGVCNSRKNVFGLMPHPERATDLRSRDGRKIWDCVTSFLSEKKAR